MAVSLSLATTAQAARLVVDLTPAGLRNTIRPAEALGAGVDGAGGGEVDALFTPHNIARLRSAGLQAFSYRLRTELGIEAWHWNPVGTWSDPGRQQGYWTSSDALGPPIGLSFGYSLPRRGNTVDNANNKGWSRLDDGDLETFWKSSPYEDLRYTHEAQARPQWLVIHLDKPQVIDAAEIAWGAPYATRYEVQYWVGGEYEAGGHWVTFPNGKVTDGKGGQVRVRLGPSGQATPAVRVLMQASSETAPPGSSDIRDRLGYAVREVRFGREDASGAFADALRHAPGRLGQSVALVSSTDPWHRAVDRDPDLEQTGLDRFFASGLTDRPVMIPVPVFFDTPENAAAEVRYLKRRDYPISRIELGEEPDGQFVDAADYGAVYMQAAALIREIDPKLEIGGPSLQNALTEVWLQPGPDRYWIGRFMAYLKARDAVSELRFFSFERYPFDDLCGDIHARLREQSRMMAELFPTLAREGVPPSIPWIMAEYGFSAFPARAEDDIEAALLMADMVGDFLTRGGDAAYYFGMAPGTADGLRQACSGHGNLMMFMADARGAATDPLPTYWAARLMTRAWLQPGDRPHRLQSVHIDGAGEAVTAFAVLRPDGRLGLLIVNRDPKAAVRLDLASKRGTGVQAVGGHAEIWSYSRAQYAWIDRGEASRPGRDLPPMHRKALLSAGLRLPPDSLTVVVAEP